MTCDERNPKRTREQYNSHTETAWVMSIVNSFPSEVKECRIIYNSVCAESLFAPKHFKKF